MAILVPADESERIKTAAITRARVRAIEAKERRAYDVDEWAEKRFYVLPTADLGLVNPEELAETKGMLRAAIRAHQRAILRFMFQKREDGTFRFRNLLYSTVKKCMTYGEYISLADGRSLPVHSLIGQTFPVFSSDGHGFVPTMAEANDNGFEPCVTISTLGGRTLTRTLNHPLYTRAGWCHAADLAVGLPIAVPKRMPEPHAARTPWDKIIVWDTITCITPAGSLPTVAITVPRYENYLAAAFEHNSGKTTIAALVGQWAAEDAVTWGYRGEIYIMANDFEQAQTRIYKAIRNSVEAEQRYWATWRTGDRRLTCHKTGTIIKPLPNDYRGEAGANPNLTLWSELWAYSSEESQRMWDEMKPSPAALVSVRFVETYRGFEDESNLLKGYEDIVLKHGRQITAGELAEITGVPIWMPGAPEPVFTEAPNPDSLVPIWVNDEARMCGYIDEGVVARRMPWQRGEAGAEYYASESITARPSDFDRHHLNIWSTSEELAIPLAQWRACYDPEMPPLVAGDRTPLVLSADAAVTKDCAGLVLFSRHPQFSDHVCIRYARKWDAKPGAPIDLTDYDAEIRRLCAEFNVVELAYDPYQMALEAQQLMKAYIVWARPFGQQKERLAADSAFLDLVRWRRVHHDGNPDLEEHIKNANAKYQMHEDSKVRFVKKNQGAHIDLLICSSMGASEILRLVL